MRKAQKRQAEDFVKLLGQAHEEIKRAIEKKNIAFALGLLEDCQEGAISLGNLLEMTAKDKDIVLILEEYCEQIYQFHKTVTEESHKQGFLINVNKMQKQLRQLFIQIRNKVQNLEVRLEVVFLPYKASMWDSLESVWKAAEKDPDCDAYVIPIPFYTRNPDGSFREMHCEAGQYPPYVPVVGYEEYDFEKRKPDMIFIHNPYDECNHVTSVHPFFYSGNLKRFTERLIYIPYFVLDEIDPDNALALDDMRHFCTLPGVMNADQVIVQSKKMRQAYVRIMTDFTAGIGYGKEYWEKKILGLGSPKIDKVLNTSASEEELEIPTEWLKIINKADGSRKKIVLYNTSVQALLQNDEKMLSKMEEVFRIFRKNEKNVALLWRPHPLIKETIKSMRPELWDRYKKIVQHYVEEGWGIYDGSADVDRAITLCDAYYGDGSSLVQLCQQAGKPVMLQNTDIQQN